MRGHHKATRPDMTLNIYLSGEIHTDWREQIIEGCEGS